MITRKTILLIIAGIILLVGLLAAFRVVTGEDTWICKDGNWEKHGNPVAEMPKEECK